MCKYLTKKAVARLLGISTSSVSRWVKTNNLPEPFLMGPNRVVWDKDEIDEWIDERKQNRGFRGQYSQHPPDLKTVGNQNLSQDD